MTHTSSHWEIAFRDVARELGIEEFESTDDVLAAAVRLKTERDISNGEASLDVTVTTFEGLRTENAELKRQAAYRATRSEFDDG